MSSMGVFRKEEIDGKSFLVYELSQTVDPTSSGETLAMGSGGDDLPFQPLFSCPRSRINFHFLNLKKDDDYFAKCHPYNSSPHFPSKRNGDQQDKSLLDCDEDDICKLPVVPLFWCNNEKPDFVDFMCYACYDTTFSTSYYTCIECEKKFHKECVESPLEIKHPSHPFHSLRLYSCPMLMMCICCRNSIENLFYHCTTCDLSMAPVCAMRPIPLVVDHPKSHPHPLTFFPTQASLVCHICAMIKKLDPTYICIQCVFVIHEHCMGFPHVIRISRHPHRISFTSSLPSGNLFCGACRQQVDNNYGAYSCKRCECYFVHSKCALHPNVWDGKELEGVPEEDDEIDDGEPFERIADGIILHPFHSHQLKLEISRTYDENKYCQGCCLPIYEGQFYSCMDCDFILHESCASASRMKRHPLYPHPLTLNVATWDPGYERCGFRCSACARVGTGFFYEYHSGNTCFKLDLQCASIIEPFEYQGHKHPLVLASGPGEEARPCQICKEESEDPKLNCMECDYIICFRCATFPYKARYKHDSHFLILCDGKEARDQPCWCEICEGKIEEVEVRRFYNCNDCCTTLHVECLLGKDIYMKPGNTFVQKKKKKLGNAIKDYISVLAKQQKVAFKSPTFELGKERTNDIRILLNSSLSRPVCTECMHRCPFPIIFKGDKIIFCSCNCFIKYAPSLSHFFL